MATDNPTIADLEEEVDLVDLDDWGDDSDVSDEYDTGWDSDAEHYFSQAARTASWNDDGWLDS